MTNSKYVEILKLSKKFDKSIVLDDVSLDVFAQENLIVFGRSGTGKSVLLKCIIGLMKPDTGRIYIDGKDVINAKLKELKEIRRKVGFLFQSAALYDSMTVRENLNFPLEKNTQMSEAERNEKIIETLKLVSLEEAVDKMPSELSGGMRKRIGLARSIITDPDLMLYDEPTTGLDPISSKEISELIINLQNKLKMTSIVVTHDLICAKIIADRAIFLQNGKIMYEGKIDELTKNDDKFLHNFFSDELEN